MARALPARLRPLLHLALLLATFCTTFATFFFFHGGGAVSGLPTPEGALGDALSFSVALLSILGAHEMGHYVMARRHGVDASLPYFIPFPFGVGTLGAIIRIRDRIPNRNALVDIGAAGPIAGMLVALPVLWLGIARSSYVDLGVAIPGEPFPGQLSLLRLVPMLLEVLLGWFGDGSAAVGSGGLATPRVLDLYGPSLVYVASKWALLGQPAEGFILAMHPFVLAAWFGILVTMLNLLPVGQLDGGHVAFACLSTRAARRLGQGAAVALVCLCVFGSAFWLLWLIIVSKVIGFSHPSLVDEAEQLTPSRKLVSALCAILLLVCFMPLPIRVVTLP